MRPRTWAKSDSLIKEISLPCNKTLPLLGKSKQPTRDIAVDLPLPLGPSKATNSPFLTKRVNPFSAATFTSPKEKSFHTSSREISRSVIQKEKEKGLYKFSEKKIANEGEKT